MFEIKEATGERVTSPARVAELLEAYKDEKKEMFFVFYLNAQNEVAVARIEFMGGWSACMTDPKVILRSALVEYASGIIIAHNHPSGNLTPSDQDLAATKRLSEAAKILDIKLLDHVIISSKGFYSMSHDGKI